LIAETNHGERPLTLHDVVYTPDFKIILMSVKKAAEKNLSITFCKQKMKIETPEGETIMEGQMSDKDLYKIKVRIMIPKNGLASGDRPEQQHTGVCPHGHQSRAST
jgi:hypothetical protein